jgi:hypothetical protein
VPIPALLRRSAAMLGAVLALAALTVAAHAWWREQQAEADLERRLIAVAPWPASGARPCPWQASGRAGPDAVPPLVLLVFGQSNAGNHGGESVPMPAQGWSHRVTVTDGARCWRVADPLPGGTGRAQSIWSRLEAALAAEGVRREVVVWLLAVDSTRLVEWTQAEGPLHAVFMERLRRASGVPIDLVLWQQGESDARAGISADAYATAWARWLQQVRAAGVEAPVMPALSTRCRNPSGAPVREALSALPRQWPGVVPGPDTDQLAGPMRERDCHFTPQGLDEAAKLWARAIKLHMGRP